MATKTHKERTKTVLQIVRDYLKDNGFDGLRSKEGDYVQCQCTIRNVCDSCAYEGCRPYRKAKRNAP